MTPVIIHNFIENILFFSAVSAVGVASFSGGVQVHQSYLQP